MDRSITLNIHASILSGFVCAGLGTNIMFLMSLKSDKSKINNNDKIQCIKTVFVLVALLFCIPSETWFFYGQSSFVLCLITDTLHSLFLDSVPLGILLVAIIRFRLAICKGNAGLLVNTKFFVTVSLSCLVILFLITTGKLIGHISITDYIAWNETVIERHDFSHCSDGVDIFNICSTMLFYIFPMVVATALYFAIVYISTSSINRIENIRNFNYIGQNMPPAPSTLRRITMFARPHLTPEVQSHATSPGHLPSVSEQQTRGAKIVQSILTLVLIFILSTLPVVGIKLYLSVSCSRSFRSRLALLYFKTIMCILHPVGEGLFNKDKRKRCGKFLVKIFRTSVTKSANHRTSHEIIQRTVVYHTNVILPTLSEESEHNAMSLTCFTNDDVFETNDELSELNKKTKDNASEAANQVSKQTQRAHVSEKEENLCGSLPGRGSRVSTMGSQNSSYDRGSQTLLSWSTEELLSPVEKRPRYWSSQQLPHPILNNLTNEEKLSSSLAKQISVSASNIGHHRSNSNKNQFRVRKMSWDADCSLADSFYERSCKPSSYDRSRPASYERSYDRPSSYERSPGRRLSYERPSTGIPSNQMSSNSPRHSSCDKSPRHSNSEVASGPSSCLSRCKDSTFISQNIPYISSRRKSFSRFTHMKGKINSDHKDDIFSYDEQSLKLAGVHMGPKNPRTLETIDSVDEQLSPNFSKTDCETLKNNLRRITLICEAI